MDYWLDLFSTGYFSVDHQNCLPWAEAVVGDFGSPVSSKDVRGTLVFTFSFCGDDFNGELGSKSAGDGSLIFEGEPSSGRFIRDFFGEFVGESVEVLFKEFVGDEFDEMFGDVFGSVGDGLSIVEGEPSSEGLFLGFFDGEFVGETDGVLFNEFVGDVFGATTSSKMAN